MFDDRVLMVGFGVMLLIALPMLVWALGGVMFSSLANFLLVGSWVALGVVWALVR